MRNTSVATHEHGCEEEAVRCPYVYVGSERVFVDEILRHQVGKKSWASDAVTIDRRHVEHGKLLVRLSEEKIGETTFVDSIALQVGAKLLTPDRCVDAWCAQDGSLFTLAYGDTIDLSFSQIPLQGEISLVVNGYYVLHSP